jgi:DNA-binding HxlR family transcriptional regulator
MRSYGQFCPVAKAAEIFCERWTALLIRDLGTGAARFSDLHRGVPLMSRSMLSRRLRELEAEGVVERKPNESGRGWTYHLTPAGREFVPIVTALGVWGRRWTRRRLAEGEIDFRLLLWEMECTVRPEALGDRRTVVQLEFIDQPAQRRHWWFVNDTGKVELCLKDPGFEVDVYLCARLVDMIHLWRGDLPLSRALETGQLEVLAPKRLKRALPAWLALGPLAGAASTRGGTASGEQQLRKVPQLRLA